MPMRSQPFQGKSLSFTVRMKTGELKPVCEFECDVLDAIREVVAVELAPEPVPDHGAEAARGQRRDHAAFELDPFGQVPVLSAGETIMKRVGAVAIVREAGIGAQQMIGLEPALLRHRRRRPCGEAEAGLSHHLGKRDFFEAYVPLGRIRLRLRRGRDPARGPEGKSGTIGTGSRGRLLRVRRPCPRG